MKSKRKFKGKTLKQWAAFARGGGTRKRTYAKDTRLHGFEDDVIERKIRESDRGSVTATELCGLYPDTFNPKLLPRAMKRMERGGRLRRTGRGWNRSPSYGLPVSRNREADDAKAA